MTGRRRAWIVVIGAALVGALIAFTACSSDDDDNAVHPLPDAANETDSADASDAAVPRGTRALGIAIGAESATFVDNAAVAVEAGASVTNVVFDWDDVEQPYDAGPAFDASAYDGGTVTALFDPQVHIANLILSGDNLQAVVALNVVDVGGSRAPVELNARTFDDPELEARYDMFTDYVFASFEDLTVPTLLVGTEVDVALGDDPVKYAAFTTFVTHAAAHVHANHPSTKVGFTVRGTGLATTAPRLAGAWAASDIVAISLLPGLDVAQAGAAADIGGAIDALVSAAPSAMPIVIQEVGTPTDPLTGGTTDNQAAFVTAVFSAWDRHADRIPILTFRELVDAQSTDATTLAARYGRSDPAFIAFLSTLGLETASGSAKPAFGALNQARAARGF